MTVISVRNLSRRFGDVTAVDNVSFDVDEGAVFGFLGPNGAGKTTTMNILCTLLVPTSGKASISGYDCATQPSEVRRSIGVVFQDSTLDRDLTAYENLVLHAYLYKVKRSEMKERIHDALHFVGLYDRRNDPVRKFSGGMKRRLEVVRGLLHRPRVLFLDEPTLGLDPQTRAKIWGFILKLSRRQNVTVFMTTHYMEEAEVCSRIAVIDNGRIIAAGTPDELKRIIGGDVVYIRTSDNRKARREIEQALNLTVSEKDGEIYFTSAKGDACIPEIIRTIGKTVQSIRLQRPTLNDVFLKMTGKEIREDALSPGDAVKDAVRAYRRRFDRG